MKNRLIVSDVLVDKNMITYKYSVEGNWRKCFRLEYEFFIEYSEDISDVPKSIAVIPLLSNMLPIAWVFDAEIIVNYVDQDFYDSIRDFKQGYIGMYPSLEFRGCLRANSVIQNRTLIPEKSAAFFSGGVDAYTTLLSHLNEKPALITLCGADVTFQDAEGWTKMKELTTTTADKYNLSYVFIKSSFKLVLNETILNRRVSRFKDNWWYLLQHSIGIISHAAPYAWKHGVNTVYFASTFWDNGQKKTLCASDPTIDNHVRFCGTKVVHDGYSFTRQEKIRRLAEYSKNTGISIHPHVCWQTAGGENCSKCEKCIRTIFGLLAEGYHPEDFGFNGYDLGNASYLLRHKEYMPDHTIVFWKDIQRTFIKNQAIIKYDPKLSWILKYNFNNTNSDPQKILRRLYWKCPRIVHRIVRAIIPKRV